jgi:hypothetical protein
MMNLWIVTYLVFGAGFGWVTYTRKHLFSEGRELPVDPAQRELLDSRPVWALVCTALWPIMAIAGLMSFWRLRKLG